MQFEGMSEAEARSFADEWLPAWTGNRPELLAAMSGSRIGTPPAAGRESRA